MPRRPNIVLTIADDQRFDTIARLGNRQIRTPNLDALGARGTSFTNAQIPGSTHPAVCAPSRAMLHTGRHFSRCSDSLCEIDGPLDLNRRPDPGRPITTLGQRLRSSGYDTFVVGKWHNEPQSLLRSFSAGSRIFFGGMCPHFLVFSHELGRDGALSQQRLISGHSTEQFTTAAVEFLRSRSRDDENPFFLYVAYTAPHDPRETFARYRALYDRDSIELPSNFAPEHPFDLGCRSVRDEMMEEYPRTPLAVRQHIADYYAMISHLDDGPGRIHAADHGLAVGQHGLMGKQNGYDHSIRVPLILAGPGLASGAIDDRLCYMQDLHPTLLEAAGIDGAAGDFQHLQSSTQRSLIDHQYADIVRSVRDAR
ncbi:MAG TPA: sulfatase-like hydrolase/transferase, partial [Tepidisphaeraceae bacterium]|nr:sulfatase-like hydrolase/transferase [Tepidisphaeraceae bacterium]